MCRKQFLYLNADAMMPRFSNGLTKTGKKEISIIFYNLSRCISYVLIVEIQYTCSSIKFVQY